MSRGRKRACSQRNAHSYAPRQQCIGNNCSGKSLGNLELWQNRTRFCWPLLKLQVCSWPRPGTVYSSTWITSSQWNGKLAKEHGIVTAVLKVLFYLGRNPKIGYTILTGFFFFLATLSSMGNFPNQGQNLSPLHWKHGTLTTRPPGESGHFNSCSKRLNCNPCELSISCVELQNWQEIQRKLLDKWYGGLKC